MTTPTTPALSHLEAIHLTSTSSAALSDSNKLEETSKLTLTSTTETSDRKNLNSDGYTRVSAVWQSGSGSMDGRVIRGSAVQGTILTARAAGVAAYLTVITSPSAGATEEKGRRYAVIFESYEEAHDAGTEVAFTASFKIDGAPTVLMGS